MVQQLEQTRSLITGRTLWLCILLIGFAQSSLIPAGKIYSQDWPAFLGPQGNGKSSEKLSNKSWESDGLKVKWSVKLGDGYGIGSVADGIVFQADRVDDQARLQAIELESGDVRWTHKYKTDYVDMYGFDGGPRSSPVIDEGRVYFSGVEGMLYCLDAADGSEIWKVNTLEQFGVIQNFFGVGSSPIIYKDRLIVMVGGSPEESQSVNKGALNLVKPNGSAIVAFNKLNGEVIYETGDDLASYATPVLATLNGKESLLAFCRQKLWCFDAETGDVRFDFPWQAKKFESVNASCPLVIDNKILLTESYGPGAVLLDVTEDRTEVIWKDEGRDRILESHWATPIEIDGFAYGCHGQHRGSAELRCINLETGEVVWSEPGLQRTSLTYVDGHFVCLTENGRLLLLKVNPEKFELVSEFSSTGESEQQPRFVYPCWAAPVIANGQILIRSKNLLTCFDLGN